MGHKEEYLIWREKNGFFTALDRRGNLITWSILSGKLLYSEPQDKDASEDNMSFYDVYRGDSEDITYTRNFYQLENYSVNLLISSLPLTEDLDSVYTSNLLD